MDRFDIAQLVLFFLVLIAIIPLLGSYMAKVFSGQNFHGKKLFQWLENGIYRTCRINSQVQMNWKEYAFGLIVFNLIGMAFLFLIQLFQQFLPGNPQGVTNVNWALAFNTAVSFGTNTNWQSYAGETTLSSAVQMIGLTVQNFLSAGTGIAVLLALVRGLNNKSTSEIGNFWVDLTRSVVYLFLPLCVVFAVILVSQGVVQTLSSSFEATTLTGLKAEYSNGNGGLHRRRSKQLGTNGGGYFGVNSAHPFENPTPLSNFFEMIAILLIPASLTYTFGKMIDNTRQGWVLFSAMFLMLVFGLAIMLYSEYSDGSVFGNTGLLEGKEMRFGITNSVLWSNITTCASNGSVNAMMSSLTPLSGMVTILNIILGEVIFGGVGSGLYGMLIFVILTVFIAGLMVGRTPEFLGKKIDAFEVKMAILGILAPSFVILAFTAISVMYPTALSSISNGGPHGFSEILYAFASAGGNNGSAFAGLNTNTVYYNVMLGLGMLIGRFGIIVPVLAISGSMAAKKKIPQSSGTLRSDTPLFVFLLIAVIMIVGALTFFPALSLGPIIEHLLMVSGRTF